MTAASAVRTTVPHCPHHRATFQAGCEFCRAHKRWYQSLRRRMIKTGQWESLQPAGPVVDHITALRRAGMSYFQIGDASGICHDTVRRIGGVGRSSGTVEAVTSAAILGVRLPDPTQLTGLVPSAGTRRRLRALAWEGWSQADVANAIGVPRPTVSHWHGPSKLILGCSAAALTDLFTRVDGSTGPSPRSRSLAQKKGWLPRRAWQADIDDPDCDPYESLGGNTLLRRQLRACAAMCWSGDDVAAWVAVTPDGVDGLAADFDRVMNRSNMHIPRWVRNAATNFFDRHAHTLGSSLAVGRQARVNGWATVMAWEGRDISDPNARPLVGHDPDMPLPEYSPISISLAIAGHVSYHGLNDVERTYVVEYFRRLGRDDGDIVTWLGWPGRNPVGALKRFLSPSRRVELPPDLVPRLRPGQLDGTAGLESSEAA